LQRRIKNSQLNIERAQKSLAEDIRALVTGSKTNKVRTSTSPRDVHAAKQHAEVSLAIFTSTIQFLCQPFNFLSAIQFLCQPFNVCASHFVSQAFLCQPFYLHQPLCVSGIFVSTNLPVPVTFCVSGILLF
jgi:hypothetical protein